MTLCKRQNRADKRRGKQCARRTTASGRDALFIQLLFGGGAAAGRGSIESERTKARETAKERFLLRSDCSFFRQPAGALCARPGSAERSSRRRLEHTRGGRVRSAAELYLYRLDNCLLAHTHTRTLDLIMNSHAAPHANSVDIFARVVEGKYLSAAHLRNLPERVYLCAPATTCCN